MPETAPKPQEAPLHGAPIEDYALIGDLESAALVSRDGSIDWLCWPDFSSPACFASLLGTAANGYWRIKPNGKVSPCKRNYRPGTMIVETRFESEQGEILLTDYMPLRGKHSDLVRVVQGVRGAVDVRMELVLRFDYGLTVPWVTMDRHELHAVAGPNQVVLRSNCSGGEPVELHGEGLTTVSEFTLKAGEEACFTLTYAPSQEKLPEPINLQGAMHETEKFWTEWSGKSRYEGPHSEAVLRSLLTLKALSYQPTGGIVAAPTTSLPESLGGTRNWDYRYCWLRDAAFTLLILILAGYTEEAVNWRLWLLRAIAGAPDQLQTMYGIKGERRLVEWTADWLPGYEHSRPVRIGNAASEQFQLDVFGEVAAALGRTPEAQDDLRVPASDLQVALADHLCKIWEQPDDGIWETRGEREHFVHSKAMAWVALDRAIKQHEKNGGKGDVQRWRQNRDMVHEQICEKGFNKKLNSFVKSYGSEDLDASCLRMVMAGFLPPDDPRMVGTVEAIQKRLTRHGLVMRYDHEKTTDGVDGDEGSFLACSFWLVICLHLIGRRDEARQLFERLLALRNDVGLLSEEFDTKAGRMVGNFPQALSHLGLVHAAFTLSDQWKPEPYNPARA